ncbi:hypothetical protein M409DRAFT_28547 [Zasmidium cellare ATCC 36951]|uniref:DUF1770-domain-containing protein n=1 Tax=Zasmidium cellare ATCC 36951 TaxID=1080233 RepID=A0A6A6C502_ZASCE|nr:uncharacterized protein M409DRAFT_28547 [Zasmidium cellare ATCC 36951]KAF2160942.1 hypothetical protein M409DRAFT_28547 [Zasmidium cellare ATCC 36951]
MAPGLEDVAIQAAETIQTAHINKAPTERDLAPSTAADTKERVVFDRSADVVSEADDVDEDEVPLSILKPLPQDQRQRMPPHLQLPDLRFEQSYLKSISSTNDWKMITYITIKDQVLMPLVQGMAWTLIVAGWRHWNGATKFSGQTVGAKIRRWWWGVNNWNLPSHPKSTLRDRKLAGQMREYYSTQANAGSD